MKHFQKYYTILFCAFCFIIPFTDFGEALPNIVLLVNVVLFPFVVKKEDFQFLNTRLFKLGIVFLVFILFQILFLQRWEDFSFLNKLLIIPAVFILSLPLKNSKIPILGFVFGALVLSLVTSFNIVQYVYKSGEFNFAVGEGINQILLGDRPYVGFIYVISTFLTLYLTQFQKSRVLKKILYVLAAFFAVLIIIISARLALLSLIVIAGCSVFYLRKKLISAIVLIGLVLVTPSVFYFNQNLQDRFFMGFEQQESSIEKAMKMEPRYHIWNCVSVIGQETKTFLIGTGFRKSEQRLTDCYAQKNGFINDEQQNWFVDSQFNTHNQFFNFYISSGILGLLIFLAFSIEWGIKSRKDYFQFAVFMAVFLFCFMENILSRQLGAMLFGLMLVFNQIIKNHSDKEV